MRVGWSPTLGYARVDREVQAVCEAAVRTLEDRGAEIVEIDRVFDGNPGLDWLKLSSTYNLRSLGHLRDTETWGRLDPEGVKLMEWSAANVSAVDLVRAEDACHRCNLALVDLFHRVHLLLTPTVAGQTGLVGGQGTIDGEEDIGWVSFTYPFNMTRSPAGTVCAGFTADGMPVGLQVVGPQHADVAVLRLMAVLEDALALDTVAPI
jgi:aspartyl-tRNA(Asn)/glutamyl-tRNA(Gln) amidotransferase subunit A